MISRVRPAAEFGAALRGKNGFGSGIWQRVMDRFTSMAKAHLAIVYIAQMLELGKRVKEHP
jgi:hypothetical protein